MAFTGPFSKRFKSMVSDADLSAKNGYGAKVGTGWALAGAEQAIGVIVNGGDALGDYIEVAYGLVHGLVAAGTITVGAQIKSDASGTWVVATAGNKASGHATTPAQSGEPFSAEIYGALIAMI